MLSSTVISIAKAVRKFKNKNPKDWAQVLKRDAARLKGKKLKDSSIPGNWLSLQYGWKPAMSDLHGAVSDLNDRERDGDAYRATVYGKAYQKTVSSPVIQSYTNIKLETQQTVEDFCKVRLDYVMENPLLASLSQLGITNPLEVVWERVPYSFVVDWFLPIGAYLNSLDAALGWSFLGGSVTDFRRYKQVGTRLVPHAPDSLSGRTWEVVLGQPSAFHWHGFAMNRSVYGYSPLPGFPSFKNPLSTGHIANAMALLVSAFR